MCHCVLLTCVTVDRLTDSLLFHWLTATGGTVTTGSTSAAGSGGKASAYVGSYASSSSLEWDNSSELCTAMSELIVGVRFQVVQYALQYITTILFCKSSLTHNILILHQIQNFVILILKKLIGSRNSNKTFIFFYPQTFFSSKDHTLSKMFS